MKHDIGYMQVHLRLYLEEELYDEFAINAFDECFQYQTDLTLSHHQVVDDKAQVHDKIFQIQLKMLEEGSRAVLHMPIHQSDAWESIGLTDKFALGFFCILGQIGQAYVESNDT